ncbi:MAG: translation initiation factor IF-2, partial [Zetaproteobacteria bacterium]
MSIRAMELAKRLGISPEDLERVAEKAGVRLATRTQELSDEEVERIQKQAAKLPATQRTAVRQARMTTGGQSAGSQEVAVQRRRARRRVVEPAKPTAGASARPRAAEVAKRALEEKAQQAAQPQATQAKPAEQQSQPRARGPRKAMSPAEIAKARVKASTPQELERQIKSERRTERRGARPAQRVREIGTRLPSPRPTRVAVAPEPTKPEKKRKKKEAKRPSLAEKVAKREYLEKRQMVLTEEEEERLARLAKGVRKKKKKEEEKPAPFVQREVEITDPILVDELAKRMAVKVSEVIQKLFSMGVEATATTPLDADTAEIIVQEFGHKPKRVDESRILDALIEEPEDDPEKLQPRPPVVVVIGHVDHGKTSLLDAIRRTNVTAAEAGGITQHIGAYMVKLPSGGRVVFIDTPGHEAFTTLRARGAQVADVAVLVVAADDGVKPQTVEAIDHAKAAGVPIVVAINKIDKPEADPEKVKRQLSEHGLIPEEWGGDTIMVPVSAKTGQGLEELLENLVLQAEVLELKANPERRGRGVVIESKLDRGRGPVATVLVKNGTFKRGDPVVCGATWGRIRAIVDENGQQHRTAGPSVPFELLGLEEVPEAGEEVVVVDSEKQAREIAEYIRERRREKELAEQKKLSLEDLFQKVQSGVKEVPVIIKGDVAGSVEAVADALAKLGTDEVRVRIVRKGVGAISESDV